MQASRCGLPLLYSLTFHPEGRTKQFGGLRDPSYRLADGSLLDLHSDPVWCRRCNAVTHGEVIESVDQIDAGIARLARLAAEI